MATHRPAPEVQAIGEKLIKKHHTHLWNTRMEWVFRSEASKSGGKTILGTAKKVSGLNALLATPDAQGDEELDFFVITIAEDIWEYLSPAQRIALVDHELCHCKIEEVNEDGDVKLMLVSHDVEEFAEVVVRHGSWRPDLTMFLRRIGHEQLRLFADAVEGGENVRDMERESTDDAVHRVAQAMDGQVLTGPWGTATVHAGSSAEPEPPDGVDGETGEVGEMDEAAASESDAERIAREQAELEQDEEF